MTKARHYYSRMQLSVAMDLLGLSTVLRNLNAVCNAPTGFVAHLDRLATGMRAQNANAQ